MITLWDTSVQLTKQEQKMKERFAKRIVASIVSRTKDPKDMRILMAEAYNLKFDIVTEFAKQEEKSQRGAD